MEVCGSEPIVANLAQDGLRVGPGGPISHIDRRGGRSTGAGYTLREFAEQAGVAGGSCTQEPEQLNSQHLRKAFHEDLVKSNSVREPRRTGTGREEVSVRERMHQLVAQGAYGVPACRAFRQCSRYLGGDFHAVR